MRVERELTRKTDAQRELLQKERDLTNLMIQCKKGLRNLHLQMDDPSFL